MTPEALFRSFRAEVVDQKKPYLWSDDEVWEFMQSAYVEFWRMVGGIPDFTSHVCAVEAVAGEPTSQLSPLILRIMSASRASDNGDVAIINSTDLGRIHSIDYGQIKTLKLDLVQGKVRYMVLGMQKDLARWVQVPDTNDTINLHVYRLPLDQIDSDSRDFAELDEAHRRWLLKWMKHLAYQKQDAETFDKGRSDTFGDEFKGYCERAKGEQGRYKHKTRVVSYGGL